MYFIFEGSDSVQSHWRHIILAMEALLQRSPPTAFEQFMGSPLLFLARMTYYFGCDRLLAPSHPHSPVRIVAVSDTHNRHSELPPLPEGDILIHAGDLTDSGTLDELRSALCWLSEQTHPHKIFIAGNHDRGLDGTSSERTELLETFPSLIYLNETSVTLTIRKRPIHIYGSPLSPKHGSWSFQYPRSDAEAGKWSNIPLHTDVLVTHGPPAHHADEGHGCKALLNDLWRVRPRLHVFGHTHAARGVERVAWSKAQAAYERICAGTWKLWDLFYIIYGSLQRDVERTTLVNAASIGGWRGDQRHNAIVIDI